MRPSKQVYRNICFIEGLVALCAAMLVDRSYLDFKKTVAHYWPEFAQQGKENITVEQLMEHEVSLHICDRRTYLEMVWNIYVIR